MTDYDAFAYTFSNSRKAMHWPEIDTIIDDMKHNNYKTLLDIGCGNGRLIREIQKKELTLDYLGIDSSSGMIQEAKKLSPNEVFLVGSMTNIGDILKGGKFDAIVLLASFHHLETVKERKQCLEALHQFLTPSGSVYITNWNLLEQKKYEKNHRGNGDFDIKIGEHTRYYHGFTLDELANLFRETGWNTLENRYFEGRRNIYSVLKFNFLS